MGHEIEACHEGNQIAQKKPVLAKSDLALCNESACDTWTLSLALSLAFAIGICFRQAEAEEDDENGWARAEPEERAPPMRSGVY